MLGRFEEARHEMQLLIDMYETDAMVRLPGSRREIRKSPFAISWMSARMATRMAA